MSIQNADISEITKIRKRLRSEMEADEDETPDPSMRPSLPPGISAGDEECEVEAILALRSSHNLRARPPNAWFSMMASGNYC